MPIQIVSPQNPRMKELNKLTKRRVRDERRVTVVEGVREAARALACGVLPVEAYVCPQLVTDEAGAAILHQLYRLDAERLLWLYEVSSDVYARVAYREESGGVLLVIPYVDRPLTALDLSPSPFLLVVEGAEKPGNLGAILRTADAAGVDGVIVCAGGGEEGTDVHNPNTVRASLGTLFSVPIVQIDSVQALLWLHENGVRLVAATPEASLPYTAVDLTGPTAIIMGGEAHGLSEMWLSAADERVMIPMRGIADSLNLATATALLLYEVVRQRSGS